MQVYPHVTASLGTFFLFNRKSLTGEIQGELYSLTITLVNSCAQLRNGVWLHIAIFACVNDLWWSACCINYCPK